MENEKCRNPKIAKFYGKLNENPHIFPSLLEINAQDFSSFVNSLKEDEIGNFFSNLLSLGESKDDDKNENKMQNVKQGTRS